MTSRDKPGSKATIDRTEKKTLLVRIGIAGVLIVGLIGALALFEQQQKPAPAPPESMKSPGPAQSLPAPGSQNQASGAIAPPSGVPAVKPEQPAEPERTGAPQIVVPGPSEKAAGASKPESDKAASSAAEDTHPRLVVGKGSELPPVAKTPPPSQPPASRPAPLESPPIARSATGSGFLVQVGVFSNLGNAEELRKKLADAGIPAQVEARVQVGPFATQAEATAAQQKIKALGMQPGMLLLNRR